jgi:Uma2 family endonuclease
MSPNTEHGALQAHLGRLLLNWIDGDPRRRRGYVYTELRTNVAGASKLPDVAFYRQRPRESARKRALEVADLAIEILSARDDLDEQRAKCQWYVDHGAQVAMLVDPVQRSITRIESVGHVEVFSSGGTLVLLPGLELALEDIFSVLDV